MVLNKYYSLGAQYRTKNTGNFYRMKGTALV